MTHESQAKAFSFDSALRRLGGDRQLLAELAKIFVADAPPVLRRLQMLVEAREAEEAAKYAHALKGMVVTFDDFDRGLLMAELVEALREVDWEEATHLMPRCERAIEELTRHCQSAIDAAK